MATDYDAPRKSDDDPVDRLDDVPEVQPVTAVATLEEDDDPGAAEAFELPGAEVDEELTIHVVPQQRDEFTCRRCFLVLHESRLAYHDGDHPVCADCAA